MLHDTPSPAIAGRTQNRRSAGDKREHHKRSLEFRLIFAAAFLLFLLTAAIERALPSRWASAAGEQAARKSIVGQAKESASIAAGYAFMG